MTGKAGVEAIMTNSVELSGSLRFVASSICEHATSELQFAIGNFFRSNQSAKSAWVAAAQYVLDERSTISRVLPRRIGQGLNLGSDRSGDDELLR
ncbi:hypothetical protein [Pseudorhodoplanes sp.]|uniref:hypothetical protein n=1 Tax=Pseudorhodoplanes sp. TaxID=1934341 RepID=UPI003D0AC8D6